MSKKLLAENLTLKQEKAEREAAKTREGAREATKKRESTFRFVINKR